MLSVCFCVIAISVRVSNAFIMLHSTIKKHLLKAPWYEWYFAQKWHDWPHNFPLQYNWWFLSFTHLLSHLLTPSVIGQPNRPGARSGSHCLCEYCFSFCFSVSTVSGSHFPTFCYGFRVERQVFWKRCATGFEISFLLFGGCVKKCQPNQQQRVYKPCSIKETARTMGPSEVI